MRSKTTKAFRKRLDALPEKVQEQAWKAYRQSAADPHPPSLQFKRVHTTAPLYSARVSKGYRAVGQIDDDTVVWFWIGSHADYDSLLARS
ncbi:type II toxin-antitoxin system RelE family toxin [Rubrivirga sp.]|uniref:type II toxin-antitoxin system RelE family toxin n=1 Tax=Rubrivirga sp. TaxID=1885344 RepID=UPI003B520519